MKRNKPKSYERMTKREKSKLKEEIIKANERISRLEKSGISQSSAAYRYLQAQYASGANWLRKDRFGNIRIKGNISKMSADKLSQVTREVSAFKKAKTSTVSGTKQARQAMVSSFNDRLSKMGINRRVTSADKIKDLYENKLFKRMQEMFYSEAVKVYYQAEKQHSKAFLKSIIKIADDIPPDDIFKMLDTHKEYEQAVRGILTAKDVQSIMIEDPIYNKMTPDQFRLYVVQVSNHKEDDETLVDAIKDDLNKGWY